MKGYSCSVGLQLCPRFEVLSQNPGFALHFLPTHSFDWLKTKWEVASGCGRGQSPLIWWPAPLYVCAREPLNNEPLYYRNLNLTKIAGNTWCMFWRGTVWVTFKVRTFFFFATFWLAFISSRCCFEWEVILYKTGFSSFLLNVCECVNEFQ